MTAPPTSLRALRGQSGPEPEIPVETPAEILAETDAGRRNMRLLIQLRWIAVGGQLATIGIVQLLMGVDLPLAQLLLAPLLLAAINLASVPLLRRGRAATNRELTAALLFDVGALTWQLYFTGGLANPFVSLFLLQIVLGAILLKPRSSWAIVGATACALVVLAIEPVPLALPPRYAADPFPLYLQGSIVCFALIALLLVQFVTRISRNLFERDAALAASRQRAAEEDHIVRMGLLASGAAHELGTPLSSLSVILGDWRRDPAFLADEELSAELADMQAELERCKTIVSGILMSAGEARGQGPEFTTVRAFLDSLIAEWRGRMPGRLDYDDGFGPDVPIVSDVALRQVVGNIIDNAVEVSPARIEVRASRMDDRLVIEVADHGPGFDEEMLAGFGQPYRSTKGRPGGGLGLFLLVNVLRKLGGAAHAWNREGGGATVRLELPLPAIARGEGEQS